MVARIQNAHDNVYYQFVGLPLEYAKQVLDKNHTGSISIQKAVNDPIFGRYIAFSQTKKQVISKRPSRWKMHRFGAPRKNSPFVFAVIISDTPSVRKPIINLEASS